MNNDNDRGVREHVAKRCMVRGCETEAEFWIDATTGFCESLLVTSPTPETFYLCSDHQYELSGKDDMDGIYVHLRIDTGELHQMEIANYACHPDCGVCND